MFGHCEGVFDMLGILRCRVSSPCRNRKELNGDIAAPRSLSSVTLALIIYAILPRGLSASTKSIPW
jgi:hypothetical protein